MRILISVLVCVLPVFDVMGQGFCNSQAFISSANGLLLLKDSFSVDEAAPIASPRTCDSGIGSWLVTDTTSNMPIVSGRLYLHGKSSPSYGDPVLYSAASFARLPGRAIFASFYTTNTGTLRIGWVTPGVTTPAWGYTSITANNFGSGGLATISQNTLYQMAVVLRGLRGWILLLKGGAFSQWTQVGIGNTTLGAVQQTLKVEIGELDWRGYLDDIYISDLGGKWNSQLCSNVASVFVPNPSNPQTATGTADGNVGCNWVPATNEIFELTFRQSDETNKLIARCVQASNQVILVKVINGVETPIKTNAVSFPVGTDIYIYSYLSGTKVQPIGFNSAVTESFNQTATGIGSSGAGTNQDLAMWPLYPTMQYRPTVNSSQVNVFVYGDSKVSTSDPSPWNVGYIAYLASLANCTEMPAKISHGGYGVQSASCFTNVINADLAAAVGTPNFVCLNIGVNDITTNAAFYANYAYMLDKIHAKWPNAHIGCMRPWSTQAAMSVWNGMADAIGVVVAARSPWAVLGPDERVFLENGDNGATYTVDGIHPNHAGHVLTATQWKSVFGL